MVNEKTRLMAEVMLLAMQVEDKTGHAVFIRYSGHVGHLEIDIRESKEHYQKEIASSGFYTNGDDERTIEKLKSVKRNLIGFLEDEEVNQDKLQYWIQEVYHYTF